MSALTLTALTEPNLDVSNAETHQNLIEFSIQDL